MVRSKLASLTSLAVAFVMLSGSSAMADNNKYQDSTGREPEVGAEETELYRKQCKALLVPSMYESAP